MRAVIWGSLSQSCLLTIATEGLALMPLSQGPVVTVTDSRVPEAKPRKRLDWRDEAPSVRRPEVGCSCEEQGSVAGTPARLAGAAALCAWGAVRGPAGAVFPRPRGLWHPPRLSVISVMVTVRSRPQQWPTWRLLGA